MEQMSPVNLPPLPAPPPGAEWLMGTRFEGVSGLVGAEFKDPAGQLLGRLVDDGAHFLASDGTVALTIPEPLASLAVLGTVRDEFIDRATGPGFQAPVDWPNPLVDRVLAARDDDFVACITTGRLSRDERERIQPGAFWHDSAALTGDWVKGQLRVPAGPNDQLDAVLATGRADVGVVIARVNGEPQVQVTSTDEALAAFNARRKEFMTAAPWPAVLAVREALEKVPATMDAATFALVPFDIIEDDDFVERAALQAPVPLPSLHGRLEVWTRRNVVMGDVAIPDVLLLAESQSRTPDEVFEALAPQARPLSEVSRSATGVTIGPMPGSPDTQHPDAGEGTASDDAGPEYDYAGPAGFGLVGGALTMDHPNLGPEIRIACDGTNVLVGMFGLAEPGGLRAEWVRGRGEPLG